MELAKKAFVNHDEGAPATMRMLLLARYFWTATMIGFFNEVSSPLIGSNKHFGSKWNNFEQTIYYLITCCVRMWTYYQCSCHQPGLLITNLSADMKDICSFATNANIWGCFFPWFFCRPSNGIKKWGIRLLDCLFTVGKKNWNKTKYLDRFFRVIRARCNKGAKHLRDQPRWFCQDNRGCC